MAETKYDKYFIYHDKEKWRWPNDMLPMVAHVDDTVVKGSYSYLVMWFFPNGSRLELDVFKAMKPQREQVEQAKILTDHPMGGHPPHIHNHAEVLFHIGTNPEDPMDLGAEVVLYMGPEMEKHVITKTCVVFIPPNFVHCPWKPVKTWRPWIHVEAKQCITPTEKSYRQLLPRELREAVDMGKIFPDVGY
jgi:hypothetical protein